LLLQRRGSSAVIGADQRELTTPVAKA